jgi:hypothetical protein
MLFIHLIYVNYSSKLILFIYFIYLSQLMLFIYLFIYLFIVIINDNYYIMIKMNGLNKSGNCLLCNIYYKGLKMHFKSCAKKAEYSKLQQNLCSIQEMITFDDDLFDSNDEILLQPCLDKL